jgi:hypothetical protein
MEEGFVEALNIHPCNIGKHFIHSKASICEKKEVGQQTSKCCFIFKKCGMSVLMHIFKLDVV